MNEEQRIKIDWLCDSPSPYNADLFQAISKEPDISLLVHYSQGTLGSHPWQDNLRKGYNSRDWSTFLGLDWYLLKLLLLPEKIKEQRLFIVGGWNRPTSILLLTLLSLGLEKYVVWTDTPNLEKNRIWWFAFLRSVWLRWILQRAYRVMGTGKPAKDVLHQMGAPLDRLIVFPYWIDLSKYSYKSNNKILKTSEHRPIRFISIGRIINSLKGHDLVLKALAELKKTTSIQFEYNILGSGEDENLILQQITQLGLEENVKLLGWLERDHVLDELCNADALIHPSPVHEPYGVVLLEAMACGKPVLASDKTCAALDRIDHEINGFIHSAGNVDLLTQHIGLLLKDSNKISEMGARARTTSEQWPIKRGISLIKEIIYGGE